MAIFSLFPIIDGNGDNLVDRLGSLVTYVMDPLPSPSFAQFAATATFPSKTAAVTGTGLTAGSVGGENILIGGTITAIDLIVDTTSTTFLQMTGLNVNAARLSGFMTGERASALANHLLRGDDLIFGSLGADVLQGLRGDDSIFGDSGSDVLSGGRGADRLSGWTGLDTLTGGGGRDTFVFDIFPGADQADQITDFTTGVDEITLDRGQFARTPALGELRAGRFVTGPEATTAAHRVIFDAAFSTLSWDRDGVGGRAAELFATLQAGATITFDDIRIVDELV